MKNNKSPTGGLEKPEESKRKIFLYKNGKHPLVLLHIFIIVTITLVAIAGVIFLTQINQRETVRLTSGQFNQQQLILARSAAAGIETFIAEIDDDVIALSNLPVVQRMEPGILKQMEVLYKGIPPQTSSRRLDKNGILRFIYPTEGWRKDLTGRNYSRKAYFQKVRETGSAVISGLIINEAGERRIRVVRPVYVENEKGDREFNGVIICSFDPDALSKLYVSPIISGETGYAWLLNENGVFLAHHEEEFMVRDAFTVRMEANPELSYDEINNIQRQMMAGKEGVGRYISGWHRGDKGKSEKLIAYTPVNVFDKVWSVAVCAPVSEVERITGEAYHSYLYTLGFIIFILTAAGIFFFIAFYRWARSLQQEIKIRKLAEERIVHLNSVLRAIRNVNQLILQEKDRDTLLQKAGDVMIEARGYDAAWLGLFKDEEAFVTVKGSGFSEDISRFSEHVMDGDYPPCIRSTIDRKEKIVIVDKSRECGDCFFKNAHTGKEAAIIRVEHAGRLFGLLAILFASGVTADDEEKRLLGEVAGDIAIALHNVELEESGKQAEEALRKSEEKYRTLVESTLDLVVTVDMKGSYTYLNPRFEKTVGYAVSELIGRPFTYIVVPELIESTNDYIKQDIREEDVPPYEADLVHKNGERIPIEFLVTTLYDTDGKPAGRLGIGRDITERKRTEQEKKNLEARLQQAQKMEAIGTLAGGIAHDFNNILAAVIGYAELADLDAPEDSKTKHSLKELLKAGHRARDLVGQILAFSRRSIQERRPVYISPVIKEALRLLRASLPTTIDIRQDIEIPPGQDTVLADPTQIHQVLMNLCTNAGHAMWEKGGVLDVSLQIADCGLRDAELKTDEDKSKFQIPKSKIDLSTGKYIRLTVSDTGCGMTPEVMGRMFDPYFTTKEKGMGTGLGLAVVHGIVESHGGAITVQSELGKGSIFHVYLPTIEREEMPEADTTEEHLPTGHERILFVDDEQALADIGKQTLERLGYEVVTRTSSIEALELFRTKPDQFDLVITDMTMPNMTGDKLAQELMNIRPDIPVILCTGYSEHISKEKAEEVGIRAFVMKPVVMRDLANTVRRVLDEQASV